MAQTVLASHRLTTRAIPFVRRHVGEVARFGSVGAVAYVVDVGTFNVLRFGPGEVLAGKPLTAKIIAAALATLVAWVGNRYWTFAAKRTGTPARELAAFVVVNGLGMAAAVACLAVSHYVLGLTSPVADNISANVVGVAVGTAIRYVAYKNWVFTGDAPAGKQAAATVPATPGSR